MSETRRNVTFQLAHGSSKRVRLTYRIGQRADFELDPRATVDQQMRLGVLVGHLFIRLASDPLGLVVEELDIRRLVVIRRHAAEEVVIERVDRLFQLRLAQVRRHFGADQTGVGLPGPQLNDTGLKLQAVEYEHSTIKLG